MCTPTTEEWIHVWFAYGSLKWNGMVWWRTPPNHEMDATFNEGVACVVAWNMVPQRHLVDAVFMQSNLFHHTCFYRSSSKVKCTVSSKKIRLCTNMYIFDFPKIILMLAVWKKYFIKQNSKVIEEQEVDFDLWSLTTQSYRQINSKCLTPNANEFNTELFNLWAHHISVSQNQKSVENKLLIEYIFKYIFLLFLSWGLIGYSEFQSGHCF